MTSDLLLRHFDRLSDAPDAVPRLRRFILDLAVRGKLVPQDPSAGPASEFLKRIKTQRARLVKEGIVRSAKPFEAETEQEKPYPIPVSWEWCRLSEVGAIVGGGTPASADFDNFTNGGSGIAWLTPADLGKHTGLYVRHGVRDLTEQGLRSSSATLMPKGSVLFTSRAPIGYTAIAANEMATNQGFKSVVPYVEECNCYIAIYFRAFGRWIDSKASGTTFREVSGRIVGGLAFPLPPLAEQKRIVAKVDELMGLCDALEVAQGERERSRDRLVASSLHHLNRSADATDANTSDESGDAARFVLDHLPRLVTRPAHVKQWRQAILDLAVRGKLVPQDPNDEPATEILKRIGAERADLVKQGRARKEKPLVPPTQEDHPFSLSGSWQWAKIGDAALFTEYGTSEQSAPSEFGVPVLKMGDIQAGRVILGGQKKVPTTIEGLPELYLEKYDLLYNRTNSPELVGKTGIYLGSDNEYTFASYLIRIRCSKVSTSPIYINLVMNSQYFRDTQIIPHLKQQCGQANVNGTILKNMLIPLPPLAEQQRIVARVEELMAVCDQLEACLTDAGADQRRLLEAVLHAAL